MQIFIRNSFYWRINWKIASKKQKWKIWKKKNISTLNRVTVNNEFFDFLKNYKKHLQITNIKFKHFRFEIQFIDKIINKTINRFDKIVKIIDALIRILFKKKFHSNIEQQILKNFIKLSINNIKCWNCENFHRFANCSNFIKKREWMQKKYEQKIVNFEKFEIEKIEMHLTNMIVKNSKIQNQINVINEFEFEMKFHSKN